MMTVLSQKGQIVLPVPVRQQLHLKAGDDFEVVVEDEDTIILRRVSSPANHGLVDHLLACPHKGWFQPFDSISYDSP
jgi:AbrB family looped-hinge helix DNA binding protein